MLLVVLPATVLVVLCYTQEAILIFWTKYENISYTSLKEIKGEAGYLIKTRNCVLPDYDPWSHSLERFLKKHEPKQAMCNAMKLVPLTNASVDRIQASTDTSVLKMYGLTRSTIMCCYQQIDRVTENKKTLTRKFDDRYKLGRCKKIDLNRGTTVKGEGIYVRCFNSRSKKVVYKNVHYFFPILKVWDKLRKYEISSKTKKSKKILNLYLVGIDSTSRQNMRRYMPKTFELLSTDTNVIELSGYNKIADNTDPNISTLLMGIDPTLLIGFHLKCYKTRWLPLDKCPFVWKSFSKRGFATVYSEDFPEIGLYHYNKPGFRKSPTDYYHRPFILLSQKKIGHKANGTNKQACQGLKLSAEVVLENALKAMESLSTAVPVFGYFYTTSLTHNVNEGASNLDDPFYNFFNNFIEKGYNKNSIIIFYSDHGMRFGKIRSTYLGHLEERLPFMMIMFPPTFKKEYPETWQNLQINKHRLVSNYDIHLTIQDIVQESLKKSSNPKTKSGKGQSLFLEVSPNRTCGDAGIPDHYCTCQSSQEVDVSDHDVIEAADKFVKHVNNNLIANYTLCNKLEVSQIISAHSAVLKVGLNPLKAPWKTFTIILKTTPGGGTFETTVFKEGSKWRVADQFSRINIYGNQSYCVEDSIIKTVCYCVQNN